MRQIRTDLAMESAGAAGEGKLPGVSISGWEEGSVRVTEVVVDEGEGARLLGKAAGTYVTLEMDGAIHQDAERRAAMAIVLAEELERLLPLEDERPILVIGLGNRNVTPDSLGPRTVEKTLVTRHIYKELPDSVDERMRPVCAIAPGVLGVTGLETLEVVRGVVKEVDPRAIVAIDALAARATARVGATVQLADTGIQPGSGVGNQRRALNRQTLGVPVVAIGVPTVIYAATIARDALGALAGEDADEGKLDQMTNDLLAGEMGEMIVTPREVDGMIDDVSGMLACGINQALHPGLSEREIMTMMK